MIDDFADMIDRCLDGLASPDDIRRLDERIRLDKPARQALLAAAALDGDLRQLLTTPARGPSAAPAAKPARKTPLPWRRVLAVAALALMAVGGWTLALFFAGRYGALCREHDMTLRKIATLDPAARPANRKEGPPVASGRIIQTRGLVVALPVGPGQPVKVPVESPIPVGRSLWTCPWGAAAVRFGDRTSIELDRSTEARISETEAGQDVELKQGILYATRRRATHPGRTAVSTAQAAVNMVDGQVAVAIEGPKTMVEVSQGQVEVTRRSDGRRMVVHEKHYVIIRDDAEPQIQKGQFVWRLEPTAPL